MKELFTVNPGLKLFSLLLAVVLEVYSYDPDNSIDAVVEADITLKNLNESMMVVDPPGFDGIMAHVKIRGPRPLVEQAKSGNYRFDIALPTEMLSSYSVELDPADLHLPFRVKVEDIEPRSLDLKMEPVLRKPLLVVPNKIGEPPAGYVVDSITVSPETVFARGPQSELDGLGVIETEKIDVSGLKAPRTFHASLVEKGSLTTLAVRAVSVSVNVVEVQDERNIDRMNITALAPDGYAATVDPSQVDIVLTGGKEALKAIKREEIKLVVDGKSFEAGRYAVNVRCELPPGVKLLRTKPEQVTLNLVKTK